MHKPFIIPTIVFILLIVGLAIVFTTLSNQMDEARTDYQSHIGDTVVLNNDTLIIIDYNMFEEIFKLNNGAELNIHYGKSLIINQKQENESN